MPQLNRYFPARIIRRRGAVLVLALVVVLAISLLGVGLLNLGSTNGMESARGRLAAQNFWVAEAGLHQRVSVMLGSKEEVEVIERKHVGAA